MYYAVIMAGGSGTRLWPLSREKRPKQALQLVGGRTMFQHAVDRLLPIFAVENIFVVTSNDHQQILSEQVPQLPETNFIIEPSGRGTAAAIGLAALHLMRLDPQGVMAVLTADHYITDTDKFRIALQVAEQVSQKGNLVTLGIKPSGPFTGYGYIQQGIEIDVIHGLPIHKVKRFTEKPDAQTAQKMVTSGEYSWNSGMFIWQTRRIMEEFRLQMPKFYTQLEVIQSQWDTPVYQDTLEKTWQAIQKNTIDYGIMEKAAKVVVIPVSMGWTDIGSWSSLVDLLPADNNGNITTGDCVLLISSGNLVFSDKRFIAAIGVHDLIIVDTGDALLICKRGEEQAVKTIVERLKEQGKTQLI